VNLGRSLGISTREASRFIENYFDGIPGVRDFIDRTKDRAREEFVVETLSGRRRPIPEIGSADHRTRSFGERIAVNTPIQGTAADILKTAMIDVDGAMRENGMDARMILTVHDELVFDCPEGERDDLIALVRERMSGAMELDVPLVVDAGSGANWSEAH
jgi:DNA polymerase I